MVLMRTTQSTPQKKLPHNTYLLNKPELCHHNKRICIPDTCNNPWTNNSKPWHTNNTSKEQVVDTQWHKEACLNNHITHKSSPTDPGTRMRAGLVFHTDTRHIMETVTTLVFCGRPSSLLSVWCLVSVYGCLCAGFDCFAQTFDFLSLQNRKYSPLMRLIAVDDLSNRQSFWKQRCANWVSR